MRKQIAAANWKMNLTVDKAEALLNDILKENIPPSENAQVIFAVPFPYLPMASGKLNNKQGYAVAAQNCSNKKNGAQGKGRLFRKVSGWFRHSILFSRYDRQRNNLY